MVDFTNYTTVMGLREKAQEAEHDNRDRVREITHFLKDKDGQWEQSIVQKMSGRPRYTFDKCNPIVKSISGELKQADFDIQVKPAGGEATKQLAKVRDGLVRNIENVSNASQVFNASARKMIETGFDAWRVTQEWADGDSFDQDLFIRKIANAVDRVWFDPGAEMQDMSDAQYCFVLQALTKDAYDEKFPKGSGMSVGEDRTRETKCNGVDKVVVGEFLWRKPEKIELVQMSNGKVYKVDGKFKSVEKELKQLGVTEEKRRKRDTFTVVTRKFDGSDWLDDEKRTVFQWLPVIPTFGNFEIVENKVLYQGAVDHLMDAQRVLNYAASRDVEEGALAPRDKLMITREQAVSDIATLQTMNTNADPVQTYTHADNQPPPYRLGGPQINGGLQTTVANMGQHITEAGGIFAANQGQQLANESGVALERLQNKGDISTVDYFESQEIAICHTAKIIIDAMPRAFDTKQQRRILNEDGSFDMQMLNDIVRDEETGEDVALNDLSVGNYDVTCSSGPSFQNRQQETTKAIESLAAIDPSIISMGADVLLNNIPAPGIDILAERARARMLEQGMIPESQWTDDERAQIQAAQEAAAQNPPEQDPVEQAILEQTQAQTADVQSKAQERADKTELAVEGLRIKEQQQIINAEQTENKQEMDAVKFALQRQDQQFQQQMDQQAQIIELLNTQAQTLKTLREAQGVDVIVGPHTQEAFIQQAELVTESQDVVSPTPETQSITDEITRQ
jgi:hypothetical protein